MYETCQYINFNVTFNPINDVSKQFILGLPQELDNFGNINTLPLTEDVPVDVPRLVANLNDSKTQVLLSKVNCAITTNFETETNADLETCIAYFKTKIDSIMQVVNKFDDANIKFNFLGITVGLVYQKENAVADLINSVTKIKGEDICDIDMQVTRIVEEKYYINTRIANTRIFDKAVNFTESGLLEKTYKEGIKVTIDVNNRYLYNKGESINSNNTLGECAAIWKHIRKTVKSLGVFFGEGIFSG